MKKKSLLLTAVATLGLTAATMAQNVPSYVPTNGLVGWWPFNGNANDESGNGNNGTVNGANLTADRFGFSNHAFDFNGVDNYIEVLHNLSLTFSNELSVSFWLNVPDLTLNASGLPERIPIGKQINASNSGIQFETNDVTNTPGSPQFYLNDGSSVAQYQDNNTIALNSWVHLVGTYDGTTLTLYSNNIVLGNNVNNLNLNSITQNLFFGKEGLIGRYFKGKLDDIGIWNRVLTQQEVTDLYSGCQLSVNTQPTNQTININTNAQFIVSSSDPSATYQWQTDLGIGFQNLNNVGQYSGTTNDTLTVSNVTMSNNNQPFRCIVSSGSCTDTSNVGVLTVNNNLGINETSRDNLFSVFPNPAQSIINVKTDLKLIGSVYSIFDNNGRIVQTGKIYSEYTTIELGNLSSGIYMFSVGENMKQSFKVIKE